MFQMLMHILMPKKCIYVVIPHNSLHALFGFSFVQSCFISFHHITIIRGILQEPANISSQHLSLFVTRYLLSFCTVLPLNFFLNYCLYYNLFNIGFHLSEEGSGFYTLNYTQVHCVGKQLKSENVTCKK